MELHGFADASQRAYAACLYLRVVDSENRMQVHLLVAKTKVAPVKAQTIPRLELCATVLFARLLNQVRIDLQLNDNPVYAWSDSQVVLAWIRGHASKWPPFVSHRVLEIQSLFPTSLRKHVASAQNPADLATRRLTPNQMIETVLWWHGPTWLHQEPQSWPRSCDTEATACLLAAPIASVAEAETPQNDKSTESLCSRFSTLNSALNVLSSCLRVRLQQPRRTRPVSPVERDDVLQRLIERAQQAEFTTELNYLRFGKALPKSSPLTHLRPFKDERGLLHVGGRLQEAKVPYNQRHPVILPKTAHLTTLIVRDAHTRTLQLVRCVLEQIYWICKGNSLIRKLLRACVRCARFSGRPVQEIMGILPHERVNPSEPFTKARVDYAGPIALKRMRGRGAKTYKGYICLFVCLCTRAILLEAVTYLTSAAFLAAFKRFISCRGMYLQLLSDNGTTFRGADKELPSLFHGASNFYKGTAHQLALVGTAWEFIPPYAPHFGGLWEAGVRSTKHHLRRVIGDQLLTFEELTTVLAQIEACLNSRPLSAMSNDPQDLTSLTPGHLLTGRALLAVPEPGIEQTPLVSWRKLTRMRDDFWRR